MDWIKWLYQQDGKTSKSALLMGAVVGLVVLFALVTAFVAVYWVATQQVTPATVGDVAPAVRDLLIGVGVLSGGAGYAYASDRTSKKTAGNE